ncbi:general transcription factor II-I repeat domain-containing protein 2B-like [Aphis craccivora]|uniref:General transcription factor II-I repeat domain-containing protein 2B-like n=1 Tax=Aphis craccivora TaxID=307492 RepID=A0A6G0Y1L1_APHCR|nr:general transcription factor II-I repeat domain-containing protein 2B-like [Aphis craccivora]
MAEVYSKERKRKLEDENRAFQAEWEGYFYIREKKLQSLKKSFACERSTLFNAMNKNELTTKASYQVTEILAQKMKPFSDAEIVKSVLSPFLSDSTCMRWSQDLAANIALNITDELHQSKCFSLALDSSTDITSISQLLLFVKYVSKDCVVKENFLGMIPMTGQT